MSPIFGEDANNELFSVNNGMIMCDMAEERFDQGYFVIETDYTYYLPLVTFMLVASSVIKTNANDDKLPKIYLAAV
jgi:hypothetical protein